MLHTVLYNIVISGFLFRLIAPSEISVIVQFIKDGAVSHSIINIFSWMYLLNLRQKGELTNRCLCIALRHFTLRCYATVGCKNFAAVSSTIEIFRCLGLMILETYTTRTGDDMKLPDCLEVECEITNKPDYSMANLSLKENNLPFDVSKKQLNGY